MIFQGGAFPPFGSAHGIGVKASLNVHADVSSHARVLNFVPSLHLLSYFVYANMGGSIGGTGGPDPPEKSPKYRVS